MAVPHGIDRSGAAGGAGEQTEQDFTQDGAGAVRRTVQDKLREWVSVTDFGAVGDGVTDDTAAIQAAISVITGPATLFFPAGIYILTSAVTKSSTGALVFLGEGAASTVLRWTASGGMSLTGLTGTIRLRGIQFQTSVAGGGTAFTGSWDSPVGVPSLIVDDVNITSTDNSSKYWTKGFRLTNAAESSFSNVTIRGNTSAVSLMTHGFDISATGAATTYVFESVLVNGVNTAVNAVCSTNPGVEGLLFDKCNFVNVTNGVVVNGSTAGYVPPGLQIVNCHINAVTCVSATAWAQVIAANCSFYTTSSFADLINVTDATVEGNTCVVIGGTPDGITVSSTSTRCHIKDNTFSMGATGASIVFGSAVTNSVARGNYRSSGSSTIVNNNAGNGNVVYGNFPIDHAFATFTASDTTPNVQGFHVDFFKTNNSGSTTITNFSNGVVSQIITVFANDNNTTLQHNVNVNLKGGTNVTLSAGQAVTLQNIGSNVWQETSRNF